MSKPIIGIVSNRSDGELNRPFTKTTSFSNMVAEKINAYNAIPMGIIFPYGVYDIEAMKQCDGFVFQGGSRIELCQILAMKYVMENKIPVLGICNGMQTMVGYDYVVQNVDNPTDYNISMFYDKEGEAGFLYKVDGHNNEDPFYIQNIDNAKHNIYFDEDSSFSYYYNTPIISALSLHKHACKESILDNSKLFMVCGKSSDGIIEAIETIDQYHYALGTQYHLEIDDQGNILFRDLVREAEYIKTLKR